MESLRPDETEIAVKFRRECNLAKEKEAAKRVRWLVENELDYIADDPADKYWTRLYRDPRDGRYWERTFLQSQLQGGGPPSLFCISPDQVREKHGIRA